MQKNTYTDWVYSQQSEYQQKIKIRHVGILVQSLGLRPCLTDRLQLSGQTARKLRFGLDGFILALWRFQDLQEQAFSEHNHA